MAVKTITIDLAAYQTLANLKRQGQSFSQVIKEHLGRRTGRHLLAALEKIEVSDAALDAVDHEIASRSEHRLQIPEL